MKRLIENVIISTVNGAFWFSLSLIVAYLLQLPEDWTKTIVSVSFGLGFIAAFIVFAIVQSIPDEPD